MPDIVIRHIDSLMAERIKQLAKERQWSINDVVLHALRHGLGMSSGNIFAETMLDPGELTVLAGQWDAKEKAVFQEAIQALSLARPTQLAPANLGLDDTLGA
ncbi:MULTISPECIES: hypothetical protein [Dyella]|uniref:Uncharacterized protein n=2 Tax=Dyella TaxID=231454 RepID=A0A4R0YS07_9GAMM|nr:MULTISPECIES: hypothetical protein [Dyella]TBR35779.1 hypothetical protein EYV96_17435 [Dyella terrae]TCI08673.1 hypothetical protein EZM97_29120 [Dyella soli]